MPSKTQPKQPQTSNENNRTYYENNKEEIKKKSEERLICKVCGKLVSRNYMPNHQRTSKCVSKKTKPKKVNREEVKDTMRNLEKLIVEDIREGKSNPKPSTKGEEEVEVIMRILDITRNKADKLMNKYQNEL
jgi:hypothetical protein